MMVIAPAFLAGIVLVQQLAQLPSWYWLVLCAGAAGLMAYWRWLFGVFFFLGVLWAALFAQYRLADRLPVALSGVDTVVTGRVADLPEQAEHLVRFDLQVTDAPPQIPSKIRLSWYAPEQALKAGQLWTFTVKLKPPHGTLNPGGFDYERWLFTEGMGATGSVRPFPKAVRVVEASWRTPLALWRQAVSDRLSAAPIPAESIALLKALTIGFGNDISPAAWTVFRQTGTTHLVVISGSHIGLIAGGVYWLVARLWARTGYLAWSPPRVAALAALVAGTVYAGLAGFSVPAQRAVVMLAVMMLAIVWQRPVRPFYTLALASFVVLVYDPLAVLSPGFWLSYFAVAVIFYAITGRLGKPHYLSEAIRINWLTSVGLSPLLLFFFQQVSLCAPLANMVAVPVISFLLVPLALLATLLLFVYAPLANVLLGAADKLLQGLMWLLSAMAQWPWASLNHPQPSGWALAMAVLGLLLLFAPRGLPSRFLGAVMLLPLLCPDNQKLRPGELNVTVLDVGQGLAVAVQTANHWLVYDTGAKFSAQSDSGLQVILPFLRLQGVARLDKLMISHGDNDHIGGAESLLQEIPAAEVLTSVPQLLQAYAPQQCVAGQAWQWDGVSFTVLSPPSGLFVSENDNSCVVKITSAYGSVLLTGDIERGAELGLLRTYGDQLHADVLVAPHHGSKTSSTASFLQTVQAETVIIPAGFQNPFGHPHAKILQRYQALGAQVLNTADSGAVTVHYANGTKALAWFRHSEARYWHYL
ncbi:DNA internalization-related competence protein ComEC/Rec2 [Methylovulum psychrotolerans]|uniref:DNA internalization-related competence protein ComEC/Rec2 n=1 Tax=Methylovulum psychrotolerans TaxID=1704499 RepID=UPI001BFF42CC|nr:DNA internalization-related competence protein ComEC/Rec2 [Methylovulum psychrotolerans]MBT9098853.1 DNA internalization-related competence protein ComEC/Rec2 [Methylovulum psychrotolerans]